MGIAEFSGFSGQRGFRGQSGFRGQRGHGVDTGTGLLLTLGVDQAVEPGDVVLGGLGAVLDE